MKRVYIAVGVLILCAAFCLFSLFSITAKSRELLQQGAKIAELAEQGAMARAKKESTALKAMWQKDTVYFSLLTTHFHYDALEECVSRLYHCSKSNQKEQLISACQDLMFEATHIITSICPSGENVFKIHFIF